MLNEFRELKDTSSINVCASAIQIEKVRLSTLLQKVVGDFSIIALARLGDNRQLADVVGVRYGSPGRGVFEAHVEA